MRHRAVRAATWIILRLVSGCEHEPLIGDLIEEYSLRARGTASSSALKWYLQQIFASLPPLLLARITRPLWIATFGVALLAYLAVGVVEFVVNSAIAGSISDPYNPLGLVIMFPVVVLIGYLAGRFQRQAAKVLGAAMFFVAATITAWSAEKTPSGYRLAFFLMGPSAALIGGALRRRQKRLPR